ncbi:hypothetical protein N7524_001821 [Penicillium chrysogenum]|nr:hypothetical protein N7524_001821 [Penicillium chrysogenum]
MNSPPDQANGSRPETDPSSSYHEHYHGLQTGSYTDQQLRHASANHLHMTSRRFFVGPIPEGWLQGHRKSWYKSRLKIRNYTSQTVSFSAGPVATHYDEHGDRLGPSSPDLDEEVALALTNTDTEAVEGQYDDEIETEAQEVAAAEPVGELRTLTHPEAEASGDDPIPEEDTETRDHSGEDDGEGQYDTYGNDLGSSSFVTAREDVASSADTGQSVATIRASGLEPAELRPKSPGSHNTNLTGHSSPNRPTTNPSTAPSEADSTTQLLRNNYKDKGKQKSKASGVSRATLQQHDPQDEDDTGADAQIQRRVTRKIAKFNLDDNIRHKQQKMRSKIAKTQGTISANRPHRRKVQDGEIVKAEKMLVCVEETLQDTLPADYTENDSLRMETRSVDKWREFLVVCRKSSAEHTPFAIQMYRTRVIPGVQRPNSKTPPYYETIVIWHPRKHGTKIFILRPKSAAHSAEWYTFIRQVLGWRRPTSLPIHVPDLGVSLIFKNPFSQLEAELKADNSDNEHIAEVADRPAVDNRFAAATIIQGCMDMLEGRAEWAEVLKAWSKTEKMGLAWKRYDRLEWVFGVNEEKMYGAMGMQSSHELELRPRYHYSTKTRHRGIQEEPAPIEGFLVRLTSQKEDGTVPTAREILDQMPLSWDVNPYPLENGEITWLSSGNREFVKRHDEEAYAHVQRNVHNISQADGYIDMCRVQEVRHVYRGSCPADPNIREGPSVDFNREPRESRQDDGATREFDDDRTFEMVLDNGLVIRLQAYDDATRGEWVKRLDALVKYWNARCTDDATELQAVRQRNLKLLDIDEAMESIVGQFAKKWEVKKAEASPHLHNMCSLSGCRTIKMSGNLYRKPRRHTTFHQCDVILTAGKLLIFRSTLRRRNGTEIPHIHQEHEATIELEDCYIYSGLITENDLLYANQTFDSNNPGLHALPRVYLDANAFTSRDEDTAITFVVWQPLSKSYFRAQEIGEQGKAKRSLRHVSTLGKHGRTIVFKARSRVEKDRWVMSISSEIDRLQEEKHEDIRLVSP